MVILSLKVKQDRRLTAVSVWIAPNKVHTLPISKGEFETINESDDSSLPDLSPDTTQGRIYRFLLKNAEKAFHQREIIRGAGAIPRPSGRGYAPSLSDISHRVRQGRIFHAKQSF